MVQMSAVSLAGSRQLNGQIVRMMMGQLSTEQTTEILDSVTGLVTAVNHETTNLVAEPNMNFWHLLWLAIIPVFLGWWLNRKGKK